MSVETKEAVSVAEMARMVGLSRPRFYQLIGTAFPYPVYDVSTKRPLYVEELQRVCLEVRRRNCGIDGRPILFYAKRVATARQVSRSRTTPGQIDLQHLIDGVKALGMTMVTSKQVAAAVEELFPKGVEGIDQAELLRSVFIQLKRQN